MLPTKRPQLNLLFEVQKNYKNIREDFSLIDKERGILSFADGFGGEVAGLKASQIGCDSVHLFLGKEGGDREATMPFVLKAYYSLATNLLFNALIFANQKILHHFKDTHFLERGGCSQLAMYLDGSVLSIAVVGHMQAYLLRESEHGEVKVQKLIQPRTYHHMVDPLKEKTQDGFEIPLQALGIYEDLEPEMVEVHVRPGDRLLLLSGSVSPDIIQSTRSFATDIKLFQTAISERLTMGSVMAVGI